MSNNSPLESTYYRNDLLERAVYLLDRYTDAHFVIPGQSCALLGKAMEIIASIRRQDVKFSFVPISGLEKTSLSYPLVEVRSYDNWKKDPRYNPHYRTKCFTSYSVTGLFPENLDRQGLRAQLEKEELLFERMDSRGKKIVILELVREGHGIANFLSMIFDSPLRDAEKGILSETEAAKLRTLSDRIIVETFNSSTDAQVNPESIIFSRFAIGGHEKVLTQADYDSWLRIPIKTGLGQGSLFRQALFARGLGDDEDHRISPPYPPPEWGGNPNFNHPTLKNADAILKELLAFIHSQSLAELNLPPKERRLLNPKFSGHSGRTAFGLLGRAFYVSVEILTGNTPPLKRASILGLNLSYFPP